MKKVRFSPNRALFLLTAMLFMCLVLFNMNVSDENMASPDGGLNGSSGKWSEFDHSAYDNETTSGDVLSTTFTWPSDGTLLVRASATSSSYTIARFNGVTIPAGLIVDFYKYDGTHDTYELLGHFDTTDGKPYTIGSGTGTGTASTPSAGGPNGNKTSSDGADTYEGQPKWSKNYDGKPDKWGRIEHEAITPGKPSVSYRNSYVDVKPSDWYYDAVMTLSDGGLLGGYGDGRFGPDDRLTRAQLAFITSGIKGYAVTENDINCAIDDYAKYKDDALADRCFAACVLGGFANKPGCHLHLLTDHERTLVSDSVGLTAVNEKYCMYVGIYDTWRGSLGKDIEYRTSIDQFPDADEIYKWIDENAHAVLQALYGACNSRKEEIEVVQRYFLAAYNLGMFAGVDAEGNFNPHGLITRGQLSQALYSVGWISKGILNYDGQY